MRALIVAATAISLVALTSCGRVATDQAGGQQSATYSLKPSGQVLGRKVIDVRCQTDFAIIWRAGQSIDDLPQAIAGCDSGISIEYAGPIDSQTLEFFQRLPEQYPSIYTVFIKSDGGVVTDAILVGRAIFERPLMVSVRERCLSACVFVLVGARARLYDDGVVGIHRVFDSRASATNPRELREGTQAIEELAEEYFREFGVSRALLDMMMSTPSGDIRYLTPQELKDFGITTRNVALQELQRNDVVQRCGAEFEARMQAAREAANSRCIHYPGMSGQVGLDAIKCQKQIQTEYGVGRYPEECG